MIEIGLEKNEKGYLDITNNVKVDSQKRLIMKGLVSL